MSEKEKIDKEEKLLRWLHPSQFNWQEERPYSAAFTNDYMSVDLSSLTTVEEDRSKSSKLWKKCCCFN